MKCVLHVNNNVSYRSECVYEKRVKMCQKGETKRNEKQKCATIGRWLNVIADIPQHTPNFAVLSICHERAENCTYKYWFASKTKSRWTGIYTTIFFCFSFCRFFPRYFSWLGSFFLFLVKLHFRVVWREFCCGQSCTDFQDNWTRFLWLFPLLARWFVTVIIYWVCTCSANIRVSTADDMRPMFIYRLQIVNVQVQSGAVQCARRHKNSISARRQNIKRTKTKHDEIEKK